MKKFVLFLFALLVATISTWGQTFSLSADIFPGPDGSYPGGSFGLPAITVFGDKLYFQADNGLTGPELWSWDGTTASLAADIVAGFDASFPENLTVYNGKLYFTADDGVNGVELWSYNGTSASLAADIYAGANSSNPSYLTVYNGKLYFQANDGINGIELWSFDGTTASIAANIYYGSGSSNPSYLAVYNGKLYFQAYWRPSSSPANNKGVELCSYNGTIASLAADIYTNAGGSYPKALTVYNGKLYFQATNGSTGEELWSYDGTTASLAAELVSGSFGSYPLNLMVFKCKLYFSATVAPYGNELWSYDGSTASLVSDIRPGTGVDSWPRYLTVYNDKLYFLASDGISGNELWSYDGSNPPSLAADIITGFDGSEPANLMVYDGKLYFQANDGITGAELWNFTTSPPPPTWSGLVNTSWNTDGNWIGNTIPLPTDDVIIPACCPNYPNLVDPATIISSDMDIEIGGSLTIAAGGKLTINGDLVITGDLLIQSGGSLITNGTVTGNATVQRFINGDMHWHFLSSPVSNQSICDGVFAPTLINFPGNITQWDFYNYMPYCNLTYNNIHWYNLRTIMGGVNTVDFPGLVFEDSRGYLVAYGDGFPTTKNFFGPLHTGDQVVQMNTIVPPHCWALPGNPFPSAVDWSQVLGKENLRRLYYYVWNDLTGNYEFWMDSFHHSANVDGNIPSMQAFFVEFDPATAETITLPNTSRVHDNTVDLWLKDSPVNTLTVTLNNTSTYNDMAMVMFEENGIIGSDRKDAEKLFSLNDQVPQIYTIIGNDLKSCLNSLPFITDGITIPVGILAPADGDYSITVKGMETFGSLKGLSLEDLSENYTQNLLVNPTYHFNATAKEDAGRFLLHFAGAIGINDINNSTICIFSSEKTVFINNAPNAQVTISNLLGQEILTTNLSDLAKNQLKVNATKGYYIVKVRNEFTVKTAKVYIN